MNPLADCFKELWSFTEISEYSRVVTQSNSNIASQTNLKISCTMYYTTSITLVFHTYYTTSIAIFFSCLRYLVLHVIQKPRKR